MENGTLVDFSAKFLLVGTIEVREWASENAEPFIVPLDTEEDFDNNGIDYAEYVDMKVGEIRNNPDDYEGVHIIRMR